MSRVLQVPVSDALFSKLHRKARQIGNGCKAEDVAEDWLEQTGREKVVLEDKFAVAAKRVDEMLRRGEISGE